MDMAVQAGVDVLQQRSKEELTFHWLYQRVQGLVDHSIYPKAGRVERWSFRVGLAAAATGLLGGLIPERLIPDDMALPLVLTCLFVEIGGFILGGAFTARR